MSLTKLYFLLFMGFFISCASDKQINTDVLVIGASTGGTAAGIQSARLGVKTLIVEESPWLGGMLTASGVSCIDGNNFLPSGIWSEFRDSLRNYYGGAGNLSTGWVSNTCFEPHVGNRIFKNMALKEKNLEIIYGYFLTEIKKEGNKITGAVFENENGEKITVTAQITIDATDLGDALPLADIPFNVGMDSKHDTNESIAPEKANDIVQDLTWVAILKDYGKDADKTIEKPANYNPEIFKGCCEQTVDGDLINCEAMLNYGRLPNNKYMLNWPRHGNDVYLNVVAMSRDERTKALQAAKERTLEFIYYIQTELGYKNLGLADDEFPTNDKLALNPYHREGRRLKGKVCFTYNHVLSPYTQQMPLYRTGISVGDYPVDHHHMCNPSVPELSFLPVPSFSVPLGALVPENTDGFIVADKAISVTNLINGSTRLQPVVLLTGQAAGTLAALSVKGGKPIAEVPVRDVQQVLLSNGAYIMPLFDVKPGDIAFEQIQKVTATGILTTTGEPSGWANRTWFYPDSTITVK